MVTGLGAISPLGWGAEEFWNSLTQGRSGIGATAHLDLAPFRSRVAGAVHGFQARKHLSDPKTLKLMTRSVSLGVAAAEAAIADSGWKPGADDPARIGCFVGSPGHAGERDELLPALALAWREGRLDLGTYGEQGIAATNPLWLLKSLANIVLYFASLKLGSHGPNANICMSGAGGVMAVGEAAAEILAGRADLALAGGYESLLDDERLESFERSGLLCLEAGDGPAASRPFDRGRQGFVPGEGAGFLMLEERQHAQARGARIYTELLGYGQAAPGRECQPFRAHETPAAFAHAAAAALAEARLSAWQLDAIFAHGLGTPASDRAEAEALLQLLGARAAYIPITAVKSLTGNLAAASGPLEIIAAAGCFAPRSMPVPAIANLDDPDPVGLDYVRRSPRPLAGATEYASRPLPAGAATGLAQTAPERGEFARRILINSASLTGVAACLVLGESPAADAGLPAVEAAISVPALQPACEAK